MHKHSSILAAVALFCGSVIPEIQAPPAPVRMTSKNPEQQRRDWEAAELKRHMRRMRNIRNAGGKSSEGEFL